MKELDIKLIDSTYPIKEAREVILSLLSDKIKFLNQQIFSVSERFGTGTEHMEKRVVQLKEEREKLSITMRKYDNNAAHAEIDCTIRIKINESELILN